MSKRIFRRGVFHLLVLLAVSALVTGCACPFKGLLAPDNGICISNEWSDPASDLTPDKDVHYGRLANGMGYVVMENREPRNRVAMYLYIRSGSLNEEDDQRGLGHFVEHMLFNGTTNFPPGTLVKRFQAMGMSFGADSNGYTAFDRTVYNIMLAGNDEPALREGLTIMADYARGGLFLEDEVNKERGVILAEKRTRDTAQYRVFEKAYKFSFEGTAAADRLVIGTDEVLTSVDSTGLKRFYDQWYRPENMVLVVVGDVSFAGVEPLIKERLTALKAEGPPPGCRDFGKIVKKGEHFFYFHEPELGHTDISIESLWDVSARPDSEARREIELPGEVAVSLMNNRLKRLVRESDRLLSEAALYSGEMFGRIGYVSLNAQTEGEKWQQALEQLHEALRQAQEQGFHQSELDRVKKEMLGDLEKEAQTAPSRDSRYLAGKIINAVNERVVLLSPGQELDFYRPRIEQLSLSEVNKAFLQLWKNRNTLVEVVGTAAIAEDSQKAEEVMRSVYNNSAKAEPGPYQESTQIEFPYLSPLEKEAVIAESREVPGIGVRTYTFGDGTVLNLKKTDFRENEILLEVRFGNGMLGESAVGLARLSEGVVNESGLGRLTREELNEALAGSNVELTFGVEENSFVLRGKGLSDELPLLLQLVHAQFNDPGFRPEAYRLSEERYRQEYDKAVQSVEGMFYLRGRTFLAGGNSRYGMATASQMAALTLEDVENWLRPVFAGAVPEISIVGDLDTEGAVKLVGSYFGDSVRDIPLGGKGEHLEFPSGKQLRLPVETNIDKSFILVAWPTEDFWDISRTRRLHVLDAVLNDRMRMEIREKLGAAYSPVVYNRSSRVDPGYGVMQAYMVVDPALAGEIVEKMIEVGRDLAEQGVSEKELSRSLKPIQTSIRDMLRTNPYWLGSVLAMSSVHPEQLHWPLTIEQDFSSISVEEISSLAIRYLQDTTVGKIIFEPAVQ